VGCAFGRLQRIDFLGLFRDGFLDVGGRSAAAHGPLACRVGIDGAVPVFRIYDNLSATHALFDNLVAAATVIAASLLRHEGALGPFLYGITNHGNHPLFQYFYTIDPSFCRFYRFAALLYSRP